MKKKICVVGPSLQMGGMERESCNMANAFDKLGHTTLFLAIFKHPKFLHLNKAVMFKEPLCPTKKLPIIKTILRIRKEIKNFGPETVLAYNTFYASIVLVATIGLSVPVFIRDGASPFFKWPIHVKLFFLVVFKIISPAGVITQTKMAIPFQKKYYKKGVKFISIPNILRPLNTFPAERENSLLGVGRLNDPLKGFDQLIKVFGLVNNKTWTLKIAGGGKESAFHLIELAKSMGVFDRTIFLGKVEDIDRIYSTAGLFVMPSRSEGFPNALCEAMASGMPSISFDFVSGPSELIQDDQNGFLIENGNLEKMAEKIDFLINNPDKRKKIGEKAKEIADKLEESKIGNDFLNFMFLT